jgi:hypothetical protein
VNAIGIRSTVATIIVELRALNQPPQDVQGFQLDIYNDAAQLSWLPATDLDVLVGGQVQVRYSTRMTTAVIWEEAQPIAQFAGSQTSGFSPQMKGTYLGKFVNSSGHSVPMRPISSARPDHCGTITSSSIWLSSRASRARRTAWRCEPACSTSRRTRMARP